MAAQERWPQRERHEQLHAVDARQLPLGRRLGPPDQRCAEAAVGHEVLIALSGSLEVQLDDSTRRKAHLLNRGYVGLYVPNMIWRELESFSTNAVCLILASEPYSESDYVRDPDEFRAMQRAR